MTDTSKVNYRLLIESLAKQVQEYSQDTSNIVVTCHAEDRMYERNISYDTTLKILRTGSIEYDGTDKRGDNVVRIRNKVNGQRSASVITAVVTRQRQLILITVMWDDEK